MPDRRLLAVWVGVLVLVLVLALATGVSAVKLSYTIWPGSALGTAGVAIIGEDVPYLPLTAELAVQFRDRWELVLAGDYYLHMNEAEPDPVFTNALGAALRYFLLPPRTLRPYAFISYAERFRFVPPPGVLPEGGEGAHEVGGGLGVVCSINGNLALVAQTRLTRVIHDWDPYMSKTWFTSSTLGVRFQF